MSKTNSRLMLFYHTLRYLRWEQIAYRGYYRFSRPRVRPLSSQAVRDWARNQQWPYFAEPSLVGPEEFVFLGEAGEVKAADAWNDTSRSKLWLYNLHYFDDLNARASLDRRAQHCRLISRWIEENPPADGNGWEPYPLSLRIVNWVKWFSQRAEDGEDAPSGMIESLAVQADILSQRLEYHILGNHLFANAKALVFAGAFLDGPDGDRWLSKGLQILDREIVEQFLPDGGHFELSPMYHATVLWDMCDLVKLADCCGIAELQSRKKRWQGTIHRGLEWLDSMVHADGDISFFNDAAMGIAPRSESLLDYAVQVGVNGLVNDRGGHAKPHYKWLEDSGYCRVQIHQDSAAILDMARVGPDYLPGHAHADTLSFELSLFGQRVLVNSGTSTYSVGKEREYQRSTQAHNTVVVDGENSSEVWGGFRVARRAFPSKPKFVVQSDELVVSCEHNGYQRLSEKCIHSRCWRFQTTRLTVVDDITGSFGYADAYFYLHPDVTVKPLTSGYDFELLLCQGQRIVFETEGADTLRIERSQWHPEFGSSVESHRIVVRFGKAGLLTEMSW